MTSAWHSHYPQDTDVPFSEWVSGVERTAKFYFDLVTRDARAVYLQALRDQAPYFRSPKAERAKADALRKYRAETSDASRLFEETCIELARDGEVSEAMSNRWDALMLPVAAQAAE
jgi:hypothetical protein